MEIPWTKRIIPTSSAAVTVRSTPAGPRTVERRVRTHNSGKGAKYTRSRLPVTLVYYETYPTRQEAMRREWEIKQLTREEKKRLIADFV